MYLLIEPGQTRFAGTETLNLKLLTLYSRSYEWQTLLIVLHDLAEPGQLPGSGKGKKKTRGIWGGGKARISNKLLRKLKLLLVFLHIIFSFSE